MQNKCSYCEKSYSARANTINHERYVHSNVRAWSCNLCPKKYKDSSDLNKHKRYVHSAPLLSCEKCHQKFQEAYLLKHMQGHIKTTSFDCTLCTKAYKKKDYLKYHMETIHDNDPTKYFCSTCKKPSKNLQQLKSH